MLTPPIAADTRSGHFVHALDPISVDVAIIGGGPAGLMAADVLSHGGHDVHVFDAMPTVGRKFLLAGIGGLNLTHAEPFETFVTRYGSRMAECQAWLRTFGPDAVRTWAHELGVETFVGSSQRVFPTDMKAAPLLRAWLYRLRHSEVPVRFHMRHRWQYVVHPISTGWQLLFQTPVGDQEVKAKVVVVALGGGSWARLGSDGNWVSALSAVGAEVRTLRPANCGFDVLVRGRRGWGHFLQTRGAGQPLKNVGLSFTSSTGHVFSRRGEFVLTQTGVEGNLIYAASAELRDEIERCGQATFELDFKPGWSLERVQAVLSRPQGSKSLAGSLKSGLGLCSLAIALLHEMLEHDTLIDPIRLAQRIKCLTITLMATRPLDEAISTAGGIALESLTPDLMLHTAPGIFCAGEMLDWEAPTGGYLLTACFASGKVAGSGASHYLQRLSAAQQ